jgi:Fe-S-cluster-containing hydrogenase component 2/CRP-like cAMP-binding protein
MSASRYAHPPDGLAGQWLPLEEVAALDFFKSNKRAFRIKLNTNFAPTAGQQAPGIKAAVKREYQKGDIICKAGEYGSTAFLLLEGTAAAVIPEHSTAAPVPGRRASSLARLKRMFRRHRRATPACEPDAEALGEISRYASLSCTNPPLPSTLRAGDFFGIDTCINFYPREATVRAEEHCVVLEMLRSVLDSIREAGSAGGRVDAAYRAAAIRGQLYLSSLFADLRGEEIDALATAADLLTPDSDQVRNDVIYNEGGLADALYVIRAGTIKLSQQKAGGEVIFTYLGRGAAFGVEALVPSAQPLRLRLQCVSHPALFPSVDVSGTLTLGRSPACDIVLPREERAVSHKHCKLEERAGDLYLVDLNSANGTLLNGETIQEARVTSGDRITVVDHVFELTWAPQQAQPAKEQVRVATATGLDNFEVIKIKNEALRQIAERNDRFLAAATAIARAVEAVTYQKRPAEQALVNDLVELNLYNSQNVLLIDLDRCTRCDQCVRACATAHDGVARFTRDGPRFGNYLVTMACRSCTDPKCMIGCPVGSIRRTESLEVHIEDWCIGCQRCATQCPFGNINMVELAAAPAAAARAPIDAAALPALRATVCDLCAGYDGPNCVYACPHDAAIRVNPAEFLSPADLR